MIQWQNPEISHWPVKCPSNMYKLYMDGSKTTVAVLAGIRYERSHKLLPSSSLPYLFVIGRLTIAIFSMPSHSAARYTRYKFRPLLYVHDIYFNIDFVSFSNRHCICPKRRNAVHIEPILLNIQLAFFMTRTMTYHCNGNY